MKRLVNEILLCVLLISLLTACGSKEARKTDVSLESTAKDITVPEKTTTEELEYKAAVPDSKFDGNAFRVLGIDPKNYNICLDFDFETESGEVLDDAIYNRNRLIEETYNIKFVSSYLSEYIYTSELLRKLAISGSDEYELIMLINRDAFSAALEGQLTPISDIPYLDFNQPWYHKDVNDQFSIKNKMFFAYTDECLNMYAQTLAILFNKNIIEQSKMDDPYDLVKEEKWTIDKFYNMACAAISDVNGDGIYTKDDICGIISEFDMLFPSIWIGSGVRTVEKNSEDIPFYSASTNEKLLGILDKEVEWNSTDGLILDSFYVFESSEHGRVIGSQHFGAGMGLFRVGCMISVLELRNMDADFGILPLPKYDEMQENYVSRMIDGWIHVVPITNTKLEMTGIILEALGAESKNEVIPVFFDIAMKSKYSRDVQSAEMLDIIFKNLTVDLGDTVWQMTIRNPIVNQILEKKNGFASTTEILTNQVDKLIKDAIEAIEAIETE